MNHLRTSGPARVAAFLLCLAMSCAAFWGGLITLSKWDDLWSGGNYYDSYSINEPLYQYQTYVSEALGLYQQGEWHGALPYSQQERYSKLMDLLTPAATNFRYQVHDEAGNLIGGNLGDESLEAVASSIGMSTITKTDGDALWRKDYTTGEGDDSKDYLMAYTGENSSFVRCDPAATAGSFNQYGWLSDGKFWTGYDSQFDVRVRTASLVVEYGVLTGLPIHDAFWTGQTEYAQIQSWLPAAAVAAGLSLCALAVLLVFLCRNAGHRQDREGITLSWMDRIPLDLYLAVDACLVAILLSAGDTAAYSFNTKGNLASVVGLCLFSVLVSAVVVGAILTLALRVKSRTLRHNTLLGRLWRAVRRAFARWPILWRVILLFCGYLFLSVLTLALTLIPALLFQGFTLWLLCRWVIQWRTVRDGTKRIVGGEPDFKIDTRNMYHDLRAHAEQLNDMGAGMSRAVEEQLKGERFKAELITNVSHDLKTPLTSIINYVDLLKKMELPAGAAREYVDVLDRKSQRLKKLTEDLVDASKASTGNLAVNLERLGLTQLLTQALGEYEEKFRQSGLTAVVTAPEGELCIRADGRHLWRVLDNLLGNCTKYALAGTRVYLDVGCWDAKACVSIKNISQSPLNIPPDQLMERFVRGEESRTTEGSGLGLSIARSLTELQGGSFRIDIDGDLFKAVVTFPVYQEPLPLAGAVAD